MTSDAIVGLSIASCLKPHAPLPYLALELVQYGSPNRYLIREE